MVSRLIPNRLAVGGWRWAVGGWTFFIAENFLLSENRTWLIDEIGDDNYHLVYGFFSTVACSSIGYGYFKLRSKSNSV